MDLRHALRLLILVSLASLTFWFGVGTFAIGMSTRDKDKGSFRFGMVATTILLWLTVLALAAEVDWL